MRNNLLIAGMEETFKKCIKLAIKKNHDYAGANKDPMGNFRCFGWQGVAVRIGDKFERLANFVKQGELETKDESVEDTLIDMINYCAICLEMYKELPNETHPYEVEGQLSFNFQNNNTKKYE